MSRSPKPVLIALSARVRTDRLREFMAGRVAEDFGIALSWGCRAPLGLWLRQL